jgi:hypothetical protein
VSKKGRILSKNSKIYKVNIYGNFALLSATLRQFAPVCATSLHFRQLCATFGNFAPLSATSLHFRQLRYTFGNFVAVSATLLQFRQLSAIFGNFAPICCILFETLFLVRNHRQSEKYGSLHFRQLFTLRCTSGRGVTYLAEGPKLNQRARIAF